MNATFRCKPFVYMGWAVLASILMTTAASAGTVTSVATGNWEDGTTWDGDVPDTSDDVFIAAGHTVTINGMSALTVNSLSVTGVLTHANNTTTESHKIDLTLSNGLFVHADGMIDADGNGFSGRNGPGGGSHYGMGASYGGRGGQSRLNENQPSKPTYGIVREPFSLGSGGFRQDIDVDGGGAIKLTVQGGTATLDGIITANGLNSTKRLNGAGSGGSVWLTTVQLSGTGTIRANGGTANAAASGNDLVSGGGGGRIAVYLTGAATVPQDLGLQAFGGTGGYRAGAGTIYVETTAHTAGEGELIIDNNSLAPSFPYVTDLKGDGALSLAVGRLTLRNRGMLGLLADNTLDLSAAVVDGDGTLSGISLKGGTLATATDFVFSNLMVYADSGVSTFSPAGTLTIATNGVFSVNVPHAVAGNVVVQPGGIINHRTNASAALYRIDLSIGGDLTIEAGGAVDVDGLGFSSGNGPGGGTHYGMGGSHGGRGGQSSDHNVQPSRPAYGDIREPIRLGSGGYGHDQSMRGGGAVRLAVVGDMLLDGLINADGQSVDTGVSQGGRLNGGGAGGSVWITAASLTGSGAIQANGGSGNAAIAGNNTASGGGGGRIAVYLTGAGSSAVTMQAVGKTGTFRGSAGTVYVQGQTQAAGEGRLIVDNAGLTGQFTTEINADVTGAGSFGAVELRQAGHLGLFDGLAMDVSGAWSNAAAFTAFGDALVSLTGSATASIYGATTFARLASTTPGKRIEFEPGRTNAVLVDLLLTGDDTDDMVLRSIAPEAAWFLNVGGSVVPTLEYLDVRYSDASPGITLAALQSQDAGFNVNWDFPSGAQTNIWLGGISSDWSDGGNWSLDRAPIPGDTRVIIGAGTFDPIMPSAQTMGALWIQTGAALNLSGYDLTLTEDAIIEGALVADGSETLTFGGDLDLSGGTFDALSTQVRLAGSGRPQALTLDGNALHRLSLSNQTDVVTFTDAVTASRIEIAGTDVHVAADVTSAVLQVVPLGAMRAYTVAAGITCTVGNLLLVGEAAAVLDLSGVGGTWYLNVTDAAEVRYVTVADSDAGAGRTLHAFASTDGLGNSNWIFHGAGASARWTGAESSDFHDPDNWDPVGVPDDSMIVLVDGPVAMTLSAPAEIGRLDLGGDVTRAVLNALLTVGGDVTVSRGAELEINLDPGLAVGQDLLVIEGAVLTHANNTSSALYRMGVDVDRDFRLSADSRIDLDWRGFAGTQGPGRGIQHGGGGSHGGRGGVSRDHDISTPRLSSRPTYGSIRFPVTLGSSGYRWPDNPEPTDGGGAVRLAVAGTSWLDGLITADGRGTSARLNGAGAGGSIWLETGQLMGSGALRANGGTSAISSDSNTTSGGGGGRIAVYLTASEGFSDVGFEALGKTGTYRGSAGTVYLETMSQSPGMGRLIFDNKGVNSYDHSFLPSEQNLELTNEFALATLIVTNASTRLSLAIDTAVGDLLVYPDASLIMTGYELTVDSFEHWLDDASKAGPGGTERVDNYEQILWKQPPAGTLFLLR